MAVTAMDAGRNFRISSPPFTAQQYFESWATEHTRLNLALALQEGFGGKVRPMYAFDDARKAWVDFIVGANLQRNPPELTASQPVSIPITPAQPTSVSPLCLSLLLDIFTGPLTTIRPDTNPYAEAVKQMADAGLVESRAPTAATPMPPAEHWLHHHVITDKGCAYVERILSTPLPQQTTTWGYP